MAIFLTRCFPSLNHFFLFEKSSAQCAHVFCSDSNSPTPCNESVRELRGKQGKTYAYTNMFNRWRNEKKVLAWFSRYTGTHGSVIRHFYMTPLGLGLSNISRKSVRMNNGGFIRANARISFYQILEERSVKKALLFLEMPAQYM